MDTVAACGDVCRNVLCTSRPDVCLLAPHLCAPWSTERECQLPMLLEYLLGEMKSPKKWEKFKSYLSNEKDPGCLGYIGDYTTQLCGDYNKPL